MIGLLWARLIGNFYCIAADALSMIRPLTHLVVFTEYYGIDIGELAPRGTVIRGLFSTIFRGQDIRVDRTRRRPTTTP